MTWNASAGSDLAIEELLNRLEDHPLSIELIAPHLKTLRPRIIREELAGRLDQFQDQSRAEGRNRSLLSSLDFSLRHLSPAARKALPWFGWFEDGMFERSFLDFSQVPEARWSGIRAELTATALLRVEDLPGFNTPYLKLHPTLAEAAAPGTSPLPPTANSWRPCSPWLGSSTRHAPSTAPPSPTPLRPWPSSPDSPTPWAPSASSCRPSPAARTNPRPRACPSPWPNSPLPCWRPWPPLRHDLQRDRRLSSPRSSVTTIKSSRNGYWERRTASEA